MSYDFSSSSHIQAHQAIVRRLIQNICNLSHSFRISFRSCSIAYWIYERWSF